MLKQFVLKQPVLVLFEFVLLIVALVVVFLVQQ